MFLFLGRWSRVAIPESARELGERDKWFRGLQASHIQSAHSTFFWSLHLCPKIRCSAAEPRPRSWKHILRLSRALLDGDGQISHPCHVLHFRGQVFSQLPFNRLRKFYPVHLVSVFYELSTQIHFLYSISLAFLHKRLWFPTEAGVPETLHL